MKMVPQKLGEPLNKSMNQAKPTRTRPMAKGVPQSRMQRGPGMNMGDTEGLHPRPKPVKTLAAAGAAAPNKPAPFTSGPSDPSQEMTPGFSEGGTVGGGGAPVAGVPHLANKSLSCKY